jgi:hypothetical protein
MVVPILIGFFSMGLRNANGPYWLSENLDPTYAYLLNSLAVANLHRPIHTDHPGTPIQVISGVVIRALNVGQSRAEMTRNVLGDPEHYVRLLNNLFILFYCLCSFIGGYVPFRVTGNLFISLLMQATPFLSSTVQLGLTGLRPEPLLVSLSLLILTVAILTFRFDVRRYAFRFALAFGLISGIAMASKINFLPVLLVPVILLPTWKSRISFSVVTATAFLISIVPVLAPLQLRNIFGFVLGVTTHTGRYGVGKPGFIDPTQYFTSVANLVRGDLPFFLALLLGIILLVIGRTRLQTGNRWRVLLAISAAEIFQLLLVAKHPHSRYLVPGLALAGLNVLLIAEALTDLYSGAKKVAALTAVSLAILLAAGIQLKSGYDKAKEQAAGQLAVTAKVDNDFQGIPVVDYYSASSRLYALKFGSGYSGNLFGPQLQKLYPDSYFYSPWEGHFSNFEGRVDVHEIASRKGWFIMHGYSFADSDFKIFLSEKPLPSNVLIENLFRGDTDKPGELDGEAIYKATISEAQP